MGSAVIRFKLGDAVFYAGSIVRHGRCSELHEVDAFTRSLFQTQDMGAQHVTLEEI